MTWVGLKGRYKELTEEQTKEIDEYLLKEDVMNQDCTFIDVTAVHFEEKFGFPVSPRTIEYRIVILMVSGDLVVPGYDYSNSQFLSQPKTEKPQ
jgi:hypothetical protein